MHTRWPAYLVVANTKLSIESSPGSMLTRRRNVPPVALPSAFSSSIVWRLQAASSGGVNPLGKAHELFAQSRAHFRFVIRGKTKIIGLTSRVQGAEAFDEADFGVGERISGVGQYRAD